MLHCNSRHPLVWSFVNQFEPPSTISSLKVPAKLPQQAQFLSNLPARTIRQMRSILSFSALAAFTSLAFASPYFPWGPPPSTPAHNGQTCTVIALGHSRDDTPQILKAFEECNNGGTVVFPEGQNYTIATKLNPVLYDVKVDWKGVWTV